MAIFAVLLTGGLAFNAVGAVSGGIMGVIGVEAFTLLACGFFLDLMAAGALSESETLAPHVLLILQLQWPFAVLLMACPLLCAAALGSGEGLAAAAVAAPVIGVLNWLHVSLFGWFLSASSFGTHTTDGFYAALGHPEQIRWLDASSLSNTIGDRVHDVIWGPSAQGYGALAVVAAAVAALAVFALRTTSIPAVLLALSAAFVLAPMTVSRIPAQPAFAALPGQNDTCEQRLTKLAIDYDPSYAEFIAVYYPQCLPPPPQIKASVTVLGDQRVRFDASGTTGMGVRYSWLTQDVNTADALPEVTVEFRYAQADVYEPRLVVLDVFDRAAEWMAPPVTVR